MRLSLILVAGLGGLALAGVLAHGIGRIVGHARAAYEDGVEAGRSEMEATYARAAEEARRAAEEARERRDAETAASIAEAERRAEDARAARNKALELLRGEDDDLDRCLAAQFPDSVRAHRPPDPGLRDRA